MYLVAEAKGSKRPKIVKRAKRYVDHRITNLGAHVTSIIICAFIDSVFYIKRMVLHLWNRAVTPRTKVKCFACDLFNWLATPYRKVKSFISSASSEVRSAYSQKGLFAAIIIGIAAVINGIWDQRRIVVTAFNYAMPVISIAFLLNLVSFATDINYAVAVSLEGKIIAYVEDETVYDSAKAIMQNRITYVDGNDIVDFAPTFEVQRVNDNKIADSYDLADVLLMQIDGEIEEAYGLYIDDVFYGAVTDCKPIETALNYVLEQYSSGTEGETASFKEQIKYEEGMYLSESIVPASDIVSVLTSVRSVAKYYTVVEGDTPIGIAAQNSVSLEELLSRNPGIDESLFPGQKLTLKGEQPYLTVQISRVENYNEAIPYETVTVQDSTKYKDTQYIQASGEEGIINKTARVTYVNGTETGRTVLSSKIEEQPVNKVVAIGTKPIPLATISTQTGQAGKFIWPVDGYYRISSYLGSSRLTGAHTGIDIPAAWGTAIFAGRGGTVVYSGKKPYYGNIVIIDHGDGFQTYYAHCSSLLVRYGEKVTLGQPIARIGSTGYSTGNHLHFEVRYNYSVLNPVDYILRP